MMVGKVLVVGSINIDLYQRTEASTVTFAGKPIDLSSIKGMTLPASSFVKMEKIREQLEQSGMTCAEGDEEKLLLTMDGPFEQKTGGKGANTAAAAGQTFACEWFGNMGAASAAENTALLRDLAAYGSVDTSRSALLPNLPTGTAYILLFDDNDNAILLLGGANQVWQEDAQQEAGSQLAAALSESVAVMLQREVPMAVNVVTARLATQAGTPVFMDVGGTNAPLDTALLPYIDEIAPNESELTFISGVPTEEGGRVRKPLVRRAVSALKAKFALAGNTRVEVLVTLGASGSMHFGAAWAAEEADLAAAGSLPHETQMGCFGLATPGGKPVDTTGGATACLPCTLQHAHTRTQPARSARVTYRIPWCW